MLSLGVAEGALSSQFAILAMLIAALAPAPGLAQVKTTSPNTVVVKYDEPAKATVDWRALDNEIQATLPPIDGVEVQSAEDGLTVFVRQSAKTKPFLEALNQRFLGDERIKVAVSDATQFEIGLPPPEPTTDRRARAKDVHSLAQLTYGLGSLPAWIHVQRTPTGVVVSIDDAARAAEIGRQLQDRPHSDWRVTQQSETTWAVGAPPVWTQTDDPMMRLMIPQALEMEVRRYLSEPPGLHIAVHEDGIVVTVPSSKSSADFIAVLHDSFLSGSGFSLTTAPCVVVHIARTDDTRARTLPIGAYDATLAGEVEREMSPPLETTVTADGLVLRARDAPYNLDRTSAVRAFLSDRPDLTFQTLPDQSIRIFATPDQPSDRPTAQQLADNVKARLARDGLQATTMEFAASGELAVTFSSPREADAFRRDVATRSGLTMRPVDGETMSGHPTGAPTPGDERLTVETPTSGGEGPLTQTIWVRPEVIISTTMIAGASVSRDVGGQPAIAFSLTDQGRRRLAAFSATHLGRQLAIILDGAVLSAPMIETPITKGEGVVSGNFTQESAASTANAIMTAKSYLPLKVVEQY
jgi:hypothetical protein